MSGLSPSTTSSFLADSSSSNSSHTATHGTVSPPATTTTNSHNANPKPVPRPHLHPLRSGSNLAAAHADADAGRVPLPPASVYDLADEENLPSPFIKRTLSGVSNSHSHPSSSTHHPHTCAHHPLHAPCTLSHGPRMACVLCPLKPNEAGVWDVKSIILHQFFGWYVFILSDFFTLRSLRSLYLPRPSLGTTTTRQLPAGSRTPGLTSMIARGKLLQASRISTARVYPISAAVSVSYHYGPECV